VPLSALALVLAAAALHATWNVLLARARDVRAATTVALVVSVLLFAPVAALTWDVEADALPWIALSSALELAYFFLLTAAYERSDLSLVYPLARGVAPVVVFGGGAVTGAAVGVWQALGVLAVAAGVLLVRGIGGPVDSRGLLLGLAIAGTIAGYTLADDRGIEHASAISYLELVLLPVAIAAVGWHAVARSLPSLHVALGFDTIAAGVASFAAYALVLAALVLAEAAPVAAVRETSILFAVALAAVLLRERVGPLRAAGAALVVAGVALVSLG
jgi:drug/metabolite transporter (DMT)-like permease